MQVLELPHSPNAHLGNPTTVGQLCVWNVGQLCIVMVLVTSAFGSDNNKTFDGGRTGPAFEIENNLTKIIVSNRLTVPCPTDIGSKILFWYHIIHMS